VGGGGSLVYLLIVVGDPWNIIEQIPNVKIQIQTLNTNWLIIKLAL
jgi:hypothetical protein